MKDVTGEILKTGNKGNVQTGKPKYSKVLQQEWKHQFYSLYQFLNPPGVYRGVSQYLWSTQICSARTKQPTGDSNDVIKIRYALKKNYGIIWEFPPPSPFWENRVYFAFRPLGTFLVFTKKLKFCHYSDIYFWG